MMRRSFRLLALPLALGACTISSQTSASSARTAEPAEVVVSSPPPTLIVFITVDQMRADYLDRFGSQLTGGLARLARGGAVFTNAFQDHAVTETAPGHATTMSGRFPSHTGIVYNGAGVQDPQAPLIGGGGPGASPFRFRGSTLTDWLRRSDPRVRALSVSRKDRGAILPIGRAHQHVYWYASDGRFTTSTYYADTLPTWVRRFDARRVPATMAGRAWTLLLPDSAYPEPDSAAAESGGTDFTFPHVLPSDPARAARQLTGFPWMDQLTLDFALAGVQALDLGAGPQTDLLAISLSTTDAIGHEFGPDSREIHDQVLRLDRSLGAFFDSLFTLRDSTRVVVALTADHGVTSFPEVYAARTHEPARYVDPDPLAKRYVQALEARGVARDAFRLEGAILFVDRPAFARAGVDADSVIDAFAADLRAMPGVRRVDRVSALADADTVHDAIARRWYHQLPPDLPAELVITLEPHDVLGGSGYAHHGSPSDDDAHVPVIFYGAPFTPGRYTDVTRVADMAPTLAAVAGVTPTQELDGRVLTEAIRQADGPASSAGHQDPAAR